MSQTTREQIAELLQRKGGRPLRAAEIAEDLGLPPAERRDLRTLLQGMAADGLVVRQGSRYARPPAADARPHPTETADGTVIVTPYGRAYLDRGEAFEQASIWPEDLGGAIDGDLVEAGLLERGRRQRARVLRVLSRGRQRFTGVLEARPWRVIPDDPRLVRPAEVLDQGEGGEGDAVLAEIVRYPARVGEPMAVKITRRLGEPGDLITEVTRAVASKDIQETFTPEVLRAAASVPKSLSPADLFDRVDLRDRRFITIDPLTARDFDDAVAVESIREGLTRIWVAVADVSHYVDEGTALDDEARRRGCSLYLPDRAIPMLPGDLSSGLCSLVPNEDRLAMVVRLDLAPGGVIADSDCLAAVIHSHGQLDYAGVAAALHGDFRGLRARYREHAEDLQQLKEATLALRRARYARGSLELDLPEANVVLDEDDPRLVRAIRASRADEGVKQAYGLVEELMLAANEVVGRLFAERGMPTLWRVHAPPKRQAITQLVHWLASYGISARSRELGRPDAVAALLRQLRGHPASRPLTYLVLRTLKQAAYSTTNVGHFGLASEAYLHFTSPIRRYPDLQVHRLLKRLLHREGLPAGSWAERAVTTEKGKLQTIAEESSAAERRALEVEREVRNVYGASLMRQHLGAEIEGTVVGVTKFGFFVSLDDPFVDGLVKRESLDESYHFDPEALRLTGRQSGHVIALGDRLRVRVIHANLRRRQVDLEVDAWKRPPSGDRSPRPRGKRGAQRRASAPPSRRRSPPGERRRRRAK